MNPMAEDTCAAVGQVFGIVPATRGVPGVLGGAADAEGETDGLLGVELDAEVVAAAVPDDEAPPLQPAAGKHSAPAKAAPA